MVTWRLFQDKPGAWDELSAGLAGASVFQTEAWARHKESLGWTCLRAVASAGGAPAAAAQFLFKRHALGAGLLWARGGPCGDPGHWDESLRSLVTRAAAAPLLYGRFCSYQEKNPDRETALIENGWRRPAAPLNKPLTFILDLGADATALQTGFSQNWAHNLRRGLKRCRVRRWEQAGASELLAIYRDMEAYKGLDAAQSEAELSSLLGHLGDSLMLYRADDENGAAVALRACAVRGRQSWDLLAASSAAGRKNYASYALLWALLQDCRARGVTRYDLGGADPEAARGVFDFKKGTGARPLDYLGEWDWAAPAWIRPLAGRAAALFGTA